MVGFDPNHAHLTPTHYAIAGTLSGFASRIVVQPLDVVKIRLQLQVESVFHPAAKYSSTLQATACIIREEGAKALWKGHATAQIQAVSFSLVQFAAFEVLTERISRFREQQRLGSGPSVTQAFRQRSAPEPLPPAAHFVCGAVAGCVASVASQPFDVLRTRFIAQGEPRVYRGLAHASELMLMQEGATVFFRGLMPTLMLMAPQTGLQFGFYAMLNSFISRISSAISGGSPIAVGDSVGPLQSVVSGGLAGVASKACVYPLDICKRRLQVQGFESARQSFGRMHRCVGIIDCMRTTVREEGALALFKGINPSLVKAAVSIGVRFAAYEQICNLIRMVMDNRSRR